MKICMVCGTYFCKPKIFCPYCGYRDLEDSVYLKQRDRERILQLTENAKITESEYSETKISKRDAESINRVKCYLIEKVKIEKILASQKIKLESLLFCLKDIVDIDIREKMKEAICKVSDSIDLLISMVLEIEFMKWQIGYSSIEKEIENREDIDKLKIAYSEINAKAHEWLNESSKVGNGKKSKETASSIELKLISIKQGISIQFASKYLENTSILSCMKLLVIEPYDKLNNAVEKLIYEIDRLNAESDFGSRAF